jgi:hypothetical protein
VAPQPFAEDAGTLPSCSAHSNDDFDGGLTFTSANSFSYAQGAVMAAISEGTESEKILSKSSSDPEM